MADPMPVFIVKGKDALAVPTLRFYRDECNAHGLNLQAHQVQKAIEEIMHWQHHNIEQTKLPDHEHKAARAAPMSRTMWRRRMADPIQAATRAIMRVEGWTDAEIDAEPMATMPWEQHGRAAYEAVLDSLLGELPEEAVEAGAERMEDYLVQLAIGTDPEDEAGPTIEYARVLSSAGNKGFLRSLRDSLASGRDTRTESLMIAPHLRPDESELPGSGGTL